MSTEARLRIGELAAGLGLNPKTVRYYEEIGLLPRPQRTPAGYRLYEAADRERLAFIVKARAVGLSLDEIGDIMAVRRLGQPPCEHVLGLLDRKIAGIDQQLRALADVRQELVSMRQEADTGRSADASVCGIIERHTSKSNRAVPADTDAVRSLKSQPEGRTRRAPDGARR